MDYLERAASTRLYSFLENDRKKFDFGCCLERDWTRPIIGQTLWKHPEGVDKDLRTLLADPDAEVCIYIARHSVKARNVWAEGINDYRRGVPGAKLYRLRPIWIPGDFDLGSDLHRQVVSDLVVDRLSSDVLLNVILGNLNPEAIRHFVASSGRVGLDLAILHRISILGFVNVPRLASQLDASRSSLPERLTRLTGCGFLTQPSSSASFYYVSLRGRVFLELCREVLAGREDDAELKRILELLNLVNGTERRHLDALLFRAEAAVSGFGVELQELNYFRYWESDIWPPDTPRPAGFGDS